MVEICRRYGVCIKAHNTDYLSSESLRWYPRLGIHSANVAPEFGVAETRALLAVLEENGLQRLADRFLEIAFVSRRWEKWMLAESRASDRERSIIAGHYVFADPAFRELKAEAARALEARGLDLGQYLKAQVRQSILRHLCALRLVRAL
jgi:hypothetical protein